MYEFYCPKCQASYPLSLTTSHCPRCNGILELRKDYTVINARAVVKKDITSMWSLREVLPHISNVVSIGEPLTPIVTTTYASPSGKKTTVFLKNEGLMPTGSFKDRGSSVLVSYMKSIGIREAATDSSGNAGVSMAVYSYVADIKLTVYSPVSISPEKKKIIEIFKASLALTSSREEASKRAKESGVYYANHSWHPIFFEGTKTFMYEAVIQVRDIDAVFVPLGSGTLFLGIMEAIKELREHDVLKDTPKIYIVRPMGYELPGDRNREPTEQTVAEGIAIKTLYRLDKIMELINSYGVSIVYVNNNDVKIGLKELLKLGIFAEPTGAAAYAGFRKAVETGEDLSYSKVLIPVTGSGFKTLDKIYRILAT